ncbi:hypothetical protein ACFQX7_30420 [Luedemannella flava]
MTRTFFVAVVLLVTVAGCGLWPADDPPAAVTLPRDYAGLLGPAGLDTFVALADSMTSVSPESARLVGPNYGVAFDALGIATAVDGLRFTELATGLHRTTSAARGGWSTARRPAVNCC